MGNFGPGMMGGYGMGWGFGWFLMLLWWVLIIAGIVVLVRWLVVGSLRDPHKSHNVPDKTALDILKERYARGEINRETFEQMRRDLTGHEGNE